MQWIRIREVVEKVDEATVLGALRRMFGPDAELGEHLHYTGRYIGLWHVVDELNGTGYASAQAEDISPTLELRESLVPGLYRTRDDRYIASMVKPQHVAKVGRTWALDHLGARTYWDSLEECQQEVYEIAARETSASTTQLLISTLEQLDDAVLPVGTVALLGTGIAAQKSDTGWHLADRSIAPWPDDELMEFAPITVLYRPGI
ncbi:hypothetical protein [Nocardia terpenica]|uniref:Uncharacterized protein n=1 Tax=Nocardia terpenica TaxID=455432 RepID=A0A161WFP6_9NOCA|nr:hypothetical protein [Nocardia terpenica]KZM75779.1 hypothetical protein AWN90_20805 [Nocardia terpenica]NQE86297.1 hypothetical protein [Nocardia terpenica]